MHVRFPVMDFMHAAADEVSLLLGLAAVRGVSGVTLNLRSGTLLLEVEPAWFVPAEAAQVVEGLGRSPAGQGRSHRRRGNARQNIAGAPR